MGDLFSDFDEVTEPVEAPGGRRRKLDPVTLAEAARLLSADFGAKGADEASARFLGDGSLEITVRHREPFFCELVAVVRAKGAP